MQLNPHREVAAVYTVLEVPKKARVSVDSIVKAPLWNQFGPPTGKTVFDENHGSDFWIRVNVSNATTNGDWALSMRMYLSIPTRAFSVSLDSFGQPIAGTVQEIERVADGSYYVFPFETRQGGNLALLMKCEVAGHAVATPTILSLSAAQAALRSEAILYAGFLGLLLVSIFYNLFLFAAMRTRVQVYYVVYLVAFMVYAVGYTGIGAAWGLRSSNVFWNLAVVGLLFWLPAFTLFVRRFLDVDLWSPLLSRIMVAYAGLGTVGPTWALVFGDFLVSVAIANVLASLLFPLAFVVGAAAWKRGVTDGPLFLLAFAPNAIGVGAAALYPMGLVPEWFRYGPIVGVGVEMALLSLVLGNRIRRMDRERTEARAEVERQEESLVNLRESNAHMFRQERDRMSRRLHDFLGAELTDMSLLVERLPREADLTHSELVARLQEGLRRALAGLRNQLQSLEDLAVLQNNMGSGLHAILLRRYSAAERTLIADIDAHLDAGLRGADAESLRTALFDLATEVATNDLKYGHGPSTWKIQMEDGQLKVDVRTGTNHEALRPQPGFGRRHLAALIEANGGTLHATVEDGSFHLVAALPCPNRGQRQN